MVFVMRAHIDWADLALHIDSDSLPKYIIRLADISSILFQLIYHTLLSPYYFLGIYQGIQCLFCCTTTVPRWSIISRILIQPCSLPSLPKTILGSRSRCSTCCCISTNVRQGPCSVGPSTLLSKTVQGGCRSI